MDDGSDRLQELQGLNDEALGLAATRRSVESNGILHRNQMRLLVEYKIGNIYIYIIYNIATMGMTGNGNLMEIYR